MSRTWSNTGHKSGSRWPTMGVSIACKTRGCTLLGPGPSKIRFGTCTACPEVCMDACPPLKDGRDGVERRLERTRGHSQHTLSTGAACSHGPRERSARCATKPPRGTRGPPTGARCGWIGKDCTDPTPSLDAVRMLTLCRPGLTRVDYSGEHCKSQVRSAARTAGG